MKKLLFFFISALLVLAIGYFYTSRKVKSLRPQDIVSKKAILIYNPSDFIDLLNNSGERYFSVFFKDSINRKINKDIGPSVAMEEITPGDFGLIFYIPFNEDILRSLELASLKNKLTISKQRFNGIDINEVRFKPSDKKFSYTVIENLFIGSASPFLVEDAIRTYTTKNKSFFGANANLKTVKVSGGSISINLKRLFETAPSIFLKNNALFNDEMILGESVLLDLKMDKESILLNGFTNDSLTNATIVLSLFTDQKPVFFQMRSLIPNSTYWLTQFGISDFKLWRKRQEAILNNLKKDHIKSALAFHQKYPIDNIFSCLGDEVAISKKKGVASDILLIEVNDWDKLFSVLKTNKIDSTFVEHYAGNEIRLMCGGNSIEYIFWPLAPKTKRSYYLYKDKYWVIGESVESLKEFVDAIDAEDTWGKSVEFEKFFETTLQESNVNFIFRGEKMQEALMYDLKPQWRKLLDSTDFFNIEAGAIQFSRLDSKFYSSVNLQIKQNHKSKKKENSTVRSFPNKIIAGPYAVRDFNSGNNQVIIQDTLNNLYLISEKDAKSLSFQLNALIKESVSQIDYLNNGKFQYAIATKNQFYLIDRLGKVVDGFPKKINEEIAFINVVDYDKTKNYRILVTNKKPGLSLYNKKIETVEGWQPKSFPDELLSKPEYYRIGGKDFLLAITKKGIIHFYNRKGDYLNKYPLDLGTQLSGNYFVENGNGLSDTFLYVITKEGVEIKMSLDGNILGKDNLVRKENSVFYLIKSENKESYCFFRISKNNIAVFDKSDALLFELPNTGSEQLRMSLYEYPNNIKIFSVFDPIQNYTSLYNEKGNSITPYPIESTLPIAIQYNSKTQEINACIVLNRTFRFLPLTNYIKAH